MTETTNSDQQAPPAPVIFLDTNAVHYATMALAFGTTNAIDVVNGDLANMAAVLQANGVGAPEWYLNGARIVKYLCHRAQDSAEFYYSPMTGLELLCGGLRAEALKRAAAVSVPYGWFSRTDEREIRTILEPDGYTLVGTRQANIDAMFDGVGITLNEKPIDKDVWELARAFMENVFIAVQDCLVYASAFLTQANELITADDFLRKTACYARNPGAAADGLTARFSAVKAAMLNKYAAISGWGLDKIVVPVQVGLPEIKAFLSGAAA